MRLRPLVVVLLLCLYSTLLVACGGAATPAASAPPPAAASPTTSQAEPPTAAASPTSAAPSAPSATAAGATASSPTVGPEGEGTPDTGQVATLCGANEESVLSCQIAGSDKVLSVCASSDLAQGGYIQYRFGSQENVELVYPETLTREVLQAFRYSRATGPGRTDLYLSFEAGDHIFRVYQLDNSGERVAGVEVRDSQGQVLTDYPCDATRVENLIMLEGLVPEGMAGQETRQAPDTGTGSVVVTFGEAPPSEMPVVYLHEINTGAFYKADMPIGAGLNQVTFEAVKPGRYQVYAHSTVFEDISYWGYWKQGGGLEVITVAAGQEQSQPTLSAPPDTCAPAYQLPASPDGVYLATADPNYRLSPCEGTTARPTAALPERRRQRAPRRHLPKQQRRSPPLRPARRSRVSQSSRKI